MKKLTTLSFLSLMIGMFCLTFSAKAQKGETPPSFNALSGKNLTSITRASQDEVNYDIKDLPPPDLSDILSKDEEDGRNGVVRKIGKSIFVNFNMQNSGTWTTLPDGSKIWRLKIKSQDALALSVYYDKFYLPPGGKLRLFNENKKQVIGPFTYADNPENGLFATELVQGETVILEYYQPANTTGEGIISISEIAYIFRDVDFLFDNKGFGDADWCEVNINCSPAGDNWQDEKRGIARILLKLGAYYGWCTGTLVGNTNQDCTPYFLTAWHCGEGASTSDLNQWIFYFNYEAPGCSNPTNGPTSNTRTGATKKAEYQISGGSDFLLLQLNQTIPTSYNLYWNGWTRATSVSSTGVSIHHPMGDIKKISYYNYIQSCTPNISGHVMATNGGWCLTWGPTGNGTGITESGSSGSPLFDNTSKIIGTLSGGNSTCSNPTADGASCGKFSYHWASNGTANSQKLQPWLDPAGTNPISLSGYYCTSLPVADFVGSPTTVVVGGTVQFTDLSSNAPTQWSWSFPGGTPPTSTSQNPTITYNTVGIYNVSLTATNAYGSDTETKINYITVIPVPTQCDTISNVEPTDTLIFYAPDDVLPLDSGYLSGNNAWNDKAKADYFSQSQLQGMTKITGAIFALHATGTGPDIRFSVWGETNGAPGTELGFEQFPLSSIVSAVQSNLFYYVDFDPDIALPTSGGIFVGVNLPPNSSDDTIAVYTNKINNTVPGTAWDKWSNNAWYPYSHLDNWGVNLSHAIYLILCPLVTDVSDNNAFAEQIHLFPNPANEYIIIQVPSSEFRVAGCELRIYDVLGREMSFDFIRNSSGFVISTNNLIAGIYYLKIQTDKIMVTKKVTVIK